MNKIRFSDKEISVAKNPVLIVGMAPGMQREKEASLVAWEGNISADLMLDALKGVKNIVLTNAFNYFSFEKISAEDKALGVKELRECIMRYDPIKIICAGSAARRAVAALDDGKTIMPKIAHVKHPSFVLRFKKSKDHWKKSLRKELV